MNLKEAKAEKGVLIAGHRGNWGGNIPPNTIASYKAALMLGVDIIESDILESRDGVFYAYHSGEERQTLGIGSLLSCLTSDEIDNLVYRNSIFNQSGIGVERMDDALSFLKGRCFINIDRGWKCSWSNTLRYLRSAGMDDQIIIKSPPEEDLLTALEKEGGNLMYMAIIKEAGQYEEVRRHKGINLVAAETNYQSVDNPISSDSFISRLHEDGILVWANALKLEEGKNLAAGWDDDSSIINGPDTGWGILLEKNYDIIQTDWPSLLIDYIRTRSMK